MVIIYEYGILFLIKNSKTLQITNQQIKLALLIKNKSSNFSFMKNKI